MKWLYKFTIQCYITIDYYLLTQTSLTFVSIFFSHFSLVSLFSLSSPISPSYQLSCTYITLTKTLNVYINIQIHLYVILYTIFSVLYVFSSYQILSQTYVLPYTSVYRLHFKLLCLFCLGTCSLTICFAVSYTVSLLLLLLGRWQRQLYLGLEQSAAFSTSRYRRCSRRISLAICRPEFTYQLTIVCMWGFREPSTLSFLFRPTMIARSCANAIALKLT